MVLGHADSIKLLPQVSLCKTCRLTWVDTFCKFFLSPISTEHGSYEHELLLLTAVIAHRTTMFSNPYTAVGVWEQKISFCMMMDLTHFPNKLWFLCVCSTSLLKTLWEKEKLLVTSNFSFSHSIFYLSGELSAIVVCKFFEFGRV